MTAREVSLNIRFTPDEMQQIMQVAEEEGRSRGDTVRRAWAEQWAARNELEQPTHLPSSRPRTLDERIAHHDG